MKRIYLANDPISANVLKLRLEESGIQAIVQDERTFALRGEVPLVYPSVWVGNEDEAAARKIALEFNHPQHGEPWTCPTCGEVLDASFADCWKCEQAPGEEKASIPVQTAKKPNWVVRSILFLVVVAALFGFYRAYAYEAYRQHFSMGLQLHKAERYDAAITEYDAAIGWNPTHADLWTHRGLAWSSKKNYERSILDFNVALSLDPAATRAYQGRGYAQYEAGSLSKALKDFLTAILIEPNREDLLSGIVYFKFELGDLDGTAKDAERLRNSKSAGFHAALMRSLIHFEKDQSDNAIKEVDFAIALDPKNCVGHVQKAHLLCFKEDYPAALKECDAAELTGNDHACLKHFYRGALMLRMGKIEEARTLMTKVLEVSQDARDEIAYRLLAHAILGDAPKMEKEMELLQKYKPECRWTYITAAGATCWMARSLELSAREKAEDKALDYLERAKEHGFAAWHLLKKDLFLKDLTAHPRFKKLAGLP